MGTEGSWVDIGLFFTAYNICAFVSVAYGFGLQSLESIPQDIVNGLMIFWLFEVFYAYTTILLRCSVAVLILRIFQKRSHKMVIYVTMSTVLLFTTIYSFLVILQCYPINFYWLRFEAGTQGTCIDLSIFPIASFTHSGVSAAADWILGLLPIWPLWDLQMNVRTKVYVGVVLGFGMFAGIASLVRVPLIQHLATTDEFFFDAVDVMTWSAIEPGFGIVATAACVIQPLFRWFHNPIDDSIPHEGDDAQNRSDRVTATGIPELELERGDIELRSRGIGSVSLSSSQSMQGGDWWKTETRRDGSFRGSNESEEELTRDTKENMGVAV